MGYARDLGFCGVLLGKYSLITPPWSAECEQAAPPTARIRPNAGEHAEGSMAERAKKKERRRLKRREKRRELHRAESGSPYRRIGTRGEMKACYINRNWRDSGQAVTYCLVAVPGEGHAMAAFLVDLWCMGLKDAWGHLQINPEEFREQMLEPMSREVELVRVDLEVVRRIVAGGIRFAEQNGFRLPRRCDRWTALLGGVGDTAAADLADFGVDGRLRFVGNVEDLRRRLIGCTPEQFRAREDVDFVIGDDDFTLLDDDQLAVDEVTDEIKTKGLAAVRQWCFGNGIAPHPRLPEAWDLLFEALFQTDIETEDGVLSEEEADATIENLGRSLALEDPQQALHLQEALGQLHGFMQQFDSSGELFESLGLETDPELD